MDCYSFVSHGQSPEPPSGFLTLMGISMESDNAIFSNGLQFFCSDNCVDVKDIRLIGPS